MRFQNWLDLQESNLHDLYASTVQAFPRTTKRQHAIDPVRIVELNWTPFLGVKTLFIKGLAQSGESGKEYTPMVLFKGVSYHDSKDHQNWIEIVASDGQHYVFERLNDDNEVLVRCDCADFKWRFNYFDWQDDSLYGRVRKKYDATANPGSANPLELPGMCKHLIKMVQALDHAGILEE
jgi:hypothetical protein